MTRMIGTGNYAAALAAKMAKVDLVAAYPITPQTEIVERLADFISNGELKSEYVTAGSEFDMMGIAIGASIAGKRTFTATSSQGSLYSYELFHQAAWTRRPLVLGFPTRCVNTWNIWPSYLDFFSNRDTGCLQVFCKSPQEVFDMTLQAYKIAEDSNVSLPVIVGYEGFVTSFLSESIDVPDQQKIDEFIPKSGKLSSIDGETVSSVGGLFVPDMYARQKKRQMEAMNYSARAINNVHHEFENSFGRSYGLVSKYNCDDADLIILGMGSMMDTVLEIVKSKYKNDKVGVVDLKWFRPFPSEDLRGLCDNADVESFVIGEGGKDILPEDMMPVMENGIKKIRKNALGRMMESMIGRKKKTVAVLERDTERILYKELKSALYGGEEHWPDNLTDYSQTSLGTASNKRAISKGTGDCSGCGAMMAVRHLLYEVRPDVAVLPASCMSVVGGGIARRDEDKLQNYVLNVNLVHTPFAAAASYATGLSRAGKKTLVLAGDGSTADIGFNNLSSAAERNENFIYVCYDNEAYMNTGVHRSSSTPYLATTTTTPDGKRENKKNLPLLMLDHNIPYVATASVGDLIDLKRKIGKAKNIEGFRYIHVLTPCPPGWKFSTEKTVDLAELATDLGIFPLWEAYNKKITIQSKSPLGLNAEESAKYDGKLKQYLTQQKRFEHVAGRPEMISSIKDRIGELWRDLDNRSRKFI